jgi:hypothetical protein
MTPVELLVASAITLGIMSGLLGAVVPAHALVMRQSERVDTTQRLRVVVETLTAELRNATLISPGARDSAVTVRNGPDVRVYYLGDAGQLRRDADGTDLPVVDWVEHLRFEHGARSVRVVIGMRDGRGARLSAAWDVELRNLPWP